MRRKINFNSLFAVLLLIGMCAGLVLEAFYSLPRADDWNLYYAVKYEMDEGKSQIAAIVEATRLLYMNHAGTFVSTFLFCFVNAFYRGGILLHALCCAFGVIVFFFSFVFFCNNYSTLLFQKKKVSHVFWSAILILAGWLDTSTPKENFYWLICVFQYLLSMSVILISASIILGTYNNKQRSRKPVYITLFILGFLSGGMGSQIPFVAFGVLLFFAITGILEKKMMVALLAGLCPSFVLFLVSPANAGRSALNAPENETLVLHLWNGLKDSTRCIARIGIKQIVTSPFFWVLIVTIVCTRLFTEKLTIDQISGKQMIIRFVASVLLIYSAVFPVCFGYRISFLSPRTENVVLLIIWILILYWVVTISRFIPYLRLENDRKKAVWPLTSAILCGVFVVVYFGGNNAGMLAYHELYSGKPQLQYENWRYIYEQVDKSNQPKVQIDIPNEYIEGLMVEHDQVEVDQDWVLARGYMNGSGKDEVVIRWHSPDGDYILSGYKEPGYWIESWKAN